MNNKATKPLNNSQITSPANQRVKSTKRMKMTRRHQSCPIQSKAKSKTNKRRLTKRWTKKRKKSSRASRKRARTRTRRNHEQTTRIEAKSTVEQRRRNSRDSRRGIRGKSGRKICQTNVNIIQIETIDQTGNQVDQTIQKRRRRRQRWRWRNQIAQSNCLISYQTTSE